MAEKSKRTSAVNAPEFQVIDYARSITFTVEGKVDTQVRISELDDGTLRFDLLVSGSVPRADLRGIFFDLQGLIADSSLTAVLINGSGANQLKAAFDEQNIERVTPSANVKGAVVGQLGGFDVGVEFGTPGGARDNIQSASFIVSSTQGSLSLDSLDLADIALRYTSVGAKVAGQTSGVAYNDAWEVDENSDGSVDLLFNDTNGILSDGTRKTISSVRDQDGPLQTDGSAYQRLVVIDGLVLGTLSVSSDGHASFTADGADINKLAHDDLLNWSVQYETRAANGDLAVANATLSIDGQNDQPVATAIELTVQEDDAWATVQDTRFGALTGDGITANFIGTDIDRGDVLSFEIISDPVDEFGNQYGTVTNNNDGTFTFNPGDQFQFLAKGESRDVTFEYVAIDDSGVGQSPTAPEQSDTSKPVTVTVTVTGEDDAAVEFSDQLLFETENQSMFYTGAALVLQPELPFFGFDLKPQSLDATIIPQLTFSGAVLEGILGGIEDFINVFAGLFGEKVDIPSSITTPGISTDGSLAAKVGLQPYFFLTSGDVDSQIPVDVYFEVPRQVESGQTFIIESRYSVDDGASFDTMSPNVEFGIDFVFDVDTDLSLVVTGSSFGAGTTLEIWDLDTADFTGFTGHLGEPGINLFHFSAEDDLEFSIPLGPLDDFVSLDINFPVIETQGSPDPVGSNTLTSEGEDDVAVLDIDIDAIVAFAIEKATGVPISFGDEDDFGLEVFGLNLISLEYAWDLIAVNLITTLKAIQEFSLEVQELPLLVTLEDGSTISGLKLGDEIEITTPAGSTFDPDVDGDADGLIDLDVAVDMDAVFSNKTWLGLDMELFVGLLRFNLGITSDLFDGFEFELFGDLLPSYDDTEQGFLWSTTEELISDLPIVTLFEEEFPIIGWNQDTSGLWFDVA